MPNYCYTELIASHEDVEQMKAFTLAVEASSLFWTFLPMAGDYDQDRAIQEWSTKWEIQDGHFELSGDGRHGFGGFSTAWHPPIAAFEKFKKLDFIIRAAYKEPNDGFCGLWEDGVQEYYIYEEEDALCSSSTDGFLSNDFDLPAIRHRQINLSRKLF